MIQTNSKINSDTFFLPAAVFVFYATAARARLIAAEAPAVEAVLIVGGHCRCGNGLLEHLVVPFQFFDVSRVRQNVFIEKL